MRPSDLDRRTVAAGLVAANLVPLVGVAAFGWELHSLLVAYWLESGVVGASFYAKIKRAAGEDDPDELPSVSFNDRSVQSFVGESNGTVARFFASHYGVFWIGHGAFVFAFAFVFPAMEPASPRIVGLAGLGLVAYHLLSYWGNYLGRREYEHAGPVTLMVEPYRRVFVLHVTIVFGAFGIAAAGAPVGLLVVMVLVKTALDVWGHWREHDRARRRSPAISPAG